MTTVYHTGIIQTFVIHTHINAQDIGEINSPSHAALVGADDHEMLIVNVQAVFVIEKSFDKLVGRLNRLESVERRCILYPGVVGVKGNDILHAHAGKFLQGCGAVKRLTSHTLALPALVEIGHDHVYSAGFPSDSADNTLQILKMIVRGHQIGKAADTVSKAVVAHIHHQIDIIAPDRFCDDRFTLAGSKTRRLYAYDVRITLISLKGEGVHFPVRPFPAPFYKPVVDFGSQRLAALQGDQSQPSHGKCTQIFGA